MKKYIAIACSFVSVNCFSHEGHLADAAGHLHGAEGLLALLIVAVGLAVKFGVGKK